MVRITYIGHSGYLVEMKDCYCLFDYYMGTVPRLDKKPLFVFVSHQHQDHYNPWIFSLVEQHSQICYILPPDVKANPGKIPVLDREQCGQLKEEGCVAMSRPVTGADTLLVEQEERRICEQSSQTEQDSTDKEPVWIYRLKARQEYEIMVGVVSLQLRTLRSTDSGVAYLVKHKETTLFHAGDLNWWHWDGDEKQYNNNMAANYRREIDMLAEEEIDVAFLPIDPKLGDYFWLGYDYFLKTVSVARVFPMHFWGETGIVGRFREQVRRNDAAVREKNPRQENASKQRRGERMEGYCMEKDIRRTQLFEPLTEGETVEVCINERFMEAVPEDKEEIMALYRAMIGKEGCTWSAEYPAEENFDYDVSHNNLFCMKNAKNEIVATIAIDDDADVAVLSNWNPSFQKAGELARLAVRAKEQNQGLARRIIQAVMRVLKDRGYDAVHYLVSPDNPAALASYAKLAFDFAGKAQLYGRSWLLYEKEL